jgi:hypothetical protein
MRSLFVVIAATLVAAATACGPGGGTYCQSGPKHGTQCYSESDVRTPPGRHPEPTEHPRKGEQPY